MKWRYWKTYLYQYAPAIPVVMFATAMLVASMVLSSCKSSQESIQPTSPKPITLDGVPTIRVRITSRPIKQIDLATTGPYRVMVDGRDVSESSGWLRKTTLSREAGRWQLGPLAEIGRTLTLIPQAGDGWLVTVGKSRYRGKLVIHAAADDSFYVHNHLDMESYLASVIAKELYPHFHLQAYRAQAVAARSFAMVELLRARKNPNSTFDVWDSQRSQVYAGYDAETSKSWKAVRDTHAWVLAYGPAGREEIFLTQFSACNGGYVNGAQVLRELTSKEKIPPLQGGFYDGDGRGCSQYQWAAVQISKREIYTALAGKYSRIRKLGNMKTLRVKAGGETHYGRAIWLEVVNSAGKSVPVRADDVRLVLLRNKRRIPAARGIYSMNCKIRDLGDRIEFYDGRGFGHGVGLSQWGAEEKARRGISGEAILEFYYPKSKLFRAY